jgi:hypothetical protein
MPFLLLLAIFSAFSDIHNKKLGTPTNNSEPRIKTQEGKNTPPPSDLSNNGGSSANTRSKNFCDSLAIAQLGLFSSIKDSKNYFIKKNIQILYQYPTQQKISEFDFFKQKTLIIGDEFSPLVLNSIKQNNEIYALDTVYNDPTIIHKDFLSRFKKHLFLASPLNIPSSVKKNFALTLGHEVFKKFTSDIERKMILINAHSLLMKEGQNRFILWDGNDEKNIQRVKEWTQHIRETSQVTLEKVTLKFTPNNATEATQTCQFDNVFYLLKILKIASN